MFVDCDFVFKSDIGLMFKHIESSRVAPIHCVKHDYDPQSRFKMDHMEQTRYNMKLWSSLMVFDMSCAGNQKLTPEVVNEADGRWLHNFKWLENDHAIGSIPESWNFIPNHSEKNVEEIDAIHYTEGGPWVPEYKNCRYANHWYSAQRDYFNDSFVVSISKGKED